MAYQITDKCISCGSCESECPNQAISEGDKTYVIDPEKCSECVGAYESSQCANTCPVDACVPDDNHQESREQLLGKWQKIHPGQKPAYT